MNSHTNTALTQLRETADVLGRPQAVVARNWIASGLVGKPWNAGRNAGIPKDEYQRAERIMIRLAKTVAS